MDSLGVALITGTDAGLRGSVFDDFAGALELYEWLGFGNDRVVELATVGSARAIGAGADTGRVAAGYRADLLVVDGDPYRELAALRAVRLVVAAGREHQPGAEG
jgi:imidazolonepropionase-like amidohydrolase